MEHPYTQIDTFSITVLDEIRKSNEKKCNLVKGKKGNVFDVI